MPNGFYREPIDYRRLPGIPGPHFRFGEFACRCCGALALDGRLVAALEAVRAMVNGPVYVLSGYRCAEHNRQVGGAPNSYHTTGEAADIYFFRANQPAAFYMVRTFWLDRKLGGVGLYEWGLHLDTGRVREWDGREARPTPPTARVARLALEKGPLPDPC